MRGLVWSHFLVVLILVLLTVLAILGLLGKVNPISEQVSIIERHAMLCKEYASLGCVGSPPAELYEICKILNPSPCQELSESCAKICCREFCKS